MGLLQTRGELRHEKGRHEKSMPVQLNDSDLPVWIRTSNSQLTGLNFISIAPINAVITGKLFFYSFPTISSMGECAGQHRHCLGFTNQ